MFFWSDFFKSKQVDKSSENKPVSEQQTSLYDGLSDELFLKIASELAPEDIGQLMAVNRYTASKLEDNVLWKVIHSQYFFPIQSKDYRKAFIESYKLIFGAYSFYAKRFLSGALRGDITAVKKYYEMHKEHLKTDVINLALIFASFVGHSTTVEFLLEDCKANTASVYSGKWETIYGLTPLHCAAMSGNLTVVKILIANGAQIDEISHNKRPMQIIHIAACYGHEALINYLLTEANPSADVNAAVTSRSASSVAWMPLHYASHNNHLKIVTSLLETGAELNARVVYNGNLGMTPFLLAAEAGNTSIVDFFLTKAVDINSMTSRKQTALHFAVIKKNLALIKLLVEKDADLNILDTDGYTPLHLAIRNDNLDAIGFFVKQNNINFSIKRNSLSSLTPFETAMECNKVAAVQMILEKLPDIHYKIESIFMNKELQEISNLIKCETFLRKAEELFEQPSYSLKTLENLFSKCFQLHPQHFYRYTLRVQDKQEFRPYTDAQREVFLALECTQEAIRSCGEILEPVTETQCVIL